MLLIICKYNPVKWSTTDKKRSACKYTLGNKDIKKSRFYEHCLFVWRTVLIECYEHRK